VLYSLLLYNQLTLAGSGTLKKTLTTPKHNADTSSMAEVEAVLENPGVQAYA